MLNVLWPNWNLVFGTIKNGLEWERERTIKFIKFAFGVISVEYIWNSENVRAGVSPLMWSTTDARIMLVLSAAIFLLELYSITVADTMVNTRHFRFSFEFHWFFFFGKTNGQIKRAEEGGLTIECHFVTTADGYILRLYRITGPKKKPIDQKTSKPMLFMHGMLASSRDFVMYPNISAGNLHKN